MWFFDAIASVQWLEVIKAFAPVATALIALIALNNWRRQDKARRDAEFLDALIDAVHAYVLEIQRPINVFEIAKFGMSSHAPTWEKGEQADIAVRGAIAYIQKNGEYEGERLLDALKTVQPSVVKLVSLAVKGQALSFEGYVKCQNAVGELKLQFDKLGALATIICSPALNWENPRVLTQLKSIMAIDPNDIRRSVDANNVAVLAFVEETYRQIYR